ncbi:HupE/UreJ family protein [Frateuria defendens]|uniref:HupE/UreJ family protein n=1 Tax=Frateuria defendens TaxID=2219559 RepID=UPI00066FEEE8|nr:HupE/UreJ family protein [Frateuria defendens]
MHRALSRRLTFTAALALPAVALAHPGGCTDGLGAGLAHPFTGLDHLLAMAAVGWWSAVTQARRWWAVPLAFAGATLLGALLGATGVLALPVVEGVIALSLVVLGGLLLAKQRLPLAVACGVAGAFALFHGYAHGAEMPATCRLGASAAGAHWLAGMVAATALLHLGGALAGRLAARHADWATRLAGAGTALTGAALLFGAVAA